MVANSTFMSRLRQGKKSPPSIKITPGPDSSFVCDFPLVPLHRDSHEDKHELKQMVEYNYSPNFTRPTSSNFSHPRRTSSVSLLSTSSHFTVTSYSTTPLSTPGLVEDDASVRDSERELKEDYFDEDLVHFFSRPLSAHEDDGDDAREQLGFAEMLLEGGAESATEAPGRVGGDWSGLRLRRESMDVMDWDGVLTAKQGEALAGRVKAILETELEGSDGIERGLRDMGF